MNTIKYSIVLAAILAMSAVFAGASGTGTSAFANTTNITNVTTPIAPVCNVGNATVYLSVGLNGTIPCGKHYRVGLLNITAPVANTLNTGSAILGVYWNGKLARVLSVAPGHHVFVWGHGSAMRITVTQTFAGMYPYTRYAVISLYKK